MKLTRMESVGKSHEPVVIRWNFVHINEQTKANWVNIPSKHIKTETLISCPIGFMYKLDTLLVYSKVTLVWNVMYVCKLGGL